MGNKGHAVNFARLLYRSWHRGCKETDILIGHFARAKLADLTDDEITLYEALLEENDWDLYAWISLSVEAPVQYHGLIRKIRDFNVSKKL